jgi:hypothetical protein
MFNNNSIFPDFADRRDLYRVWIRANGLDKAPLVSIWIDPKMSAFESEMEALTAQRSRLRPKNPAASLQTRTR